MLVLKRRKGESVEIQCPCGRCTTVTVVEYVGKHHGLRLGFEAPADVQIVRDDVKDQRPQPREG